MTFTKEVTLWCNGEDCWATWKDGFATATKARKHARKDGWINRGVSDYCPDCKDKEENR